MNLTLKSFTFNEPIAIVIVGDKKALLNYSEEGELKVKNENVEIGYRHYEVFPLKQIEMKDLVTLGKETLFKNTDIVFGELRKHGYWIPKL